MTLQQRLQSTTSWTARHILQDEIAMFGRNDQVSEYQEQKIQRAEMQDRWAETDPVYCAETNAHITAFYQTHPEVL